MRSLFAPLAVVAFMASAALAFPHPEAVADAAPAPQVTTPPSLTARDIDAIRSLIQRGALDKDLVKRQGLLGGLVGDAVGAATPELISAAPGLFSAILPELLSAAPSLLVAVLPALESAAPQLLSAVLPALESAAPALAKAAIPAIISAIGPEIGGLLGGSSSTTKPPNPAPTKLKVRAGSTPTAAPTPTATLLPQ